MYAWQSYSEQLDPVPLAWLRTARRHPANMCCADADGSPLNNRQMVASVTACARALKLKRKQATVGLMLPASSGAAIATLAIQLKGRAVVPLDYNAGEAGLTAAAKASGISLVVTSRAFVQSLSRRDIDLSSLLQDHSVCYLEDTLESATAWRTALAGIQLALLPAAWFYRLHGHRARIEDPAAILFSRGSERQPRAVVLSHRNIVSNCKQVSDVLNTREDDVVMSSLPPCTALGFSVTTVMPLVEGIPMACSPDPDNTLAVAKAIARHRATVLLAPPALLGLYAANEEVHPLMLKSLRVVVSGSEPLSEQVRGDFELKFGKTVYQGYGATETSPVASVNIPDAMDITDWKVQQGNAAGTVGMPLPGTSFRIVDPDTLEQRPLEEDGLVLIAGNQVMSGYLDDAEGTSRVISEIDGMRWFHSGDLGHLTQEGFLVITRPRTAGGA